MMLDQWGVVVSNVTHIDKLKGEKFGMLDVGFQEHDPRQAGVHEVFGAGMRKGKVSFFRPDWLSPFARVCYPEPMKDHIMGFCRPCLPKKSADDGKRKLLQEVDIV